MKRDSADVHLNGFGVVLNPNVDDLLVKIGFII